MFPVGRSKRCIAWVKWKHVCLPKAVGGLGIKDLDLFNLSLLGKWKWRFIVGSEAYWYNILSSWYGAMNYISNQHVWNSRNSSQWWRDVCN